MKINHITIPVANRDRAARFYADTLGLQIIEKGTSKWVQVGEQYIHLAQNSGLPANHSFYHFCISIAEVKKQVEKLMLAGIDVFDLSDTLDIVDMNDNLDRQNRQFFFHDPDGNLVELIDEKNEFFK